LTFRHELRRFLSFSEKAARQAGIEPRQHQLLLAVRSLRGREVASISTLAEMLQLRHHSTVELVNRLQAKGLVRRQRSEKDRRKVVVCLTPEGESVLRQLSVAHRAELLVVGRRLVDVLNGLAADGAFGDSA
ncbi:MAG: MarR family winged helix-turn-helix transcriptional regulator, partial [Hyphomicrobiales bacterium]